MAYEKADYDSMYRISARDPVTNHRYANFNSPELRAQGITDLTLRLHYHGAVIKPKYKIDPVQDPGRVWLVPRLIDYLIAEGTPLSSTSVVCILGGVFGWLGEALEDEFPGLSAVTIDLSDYVQDTKDLSQDDELIASINGAGYDETSGAGLFLFDKFKDPNPRSRNPNRVMKEDLKNNASLNRIRNQIPRDITHGITEEMWQDSNVTQLQKDRITDAAATWNVSLTHIIDGVFS